MFNEWRLKGDGDGDPIQQIEMCRVQKKDVSVRNNSCISAHRITRRKFCFE